MIINVSLSLLVVWSSAHFFEINMIIFLLSQYFIIIGLHYLLQQKKC